MTTAPPNPYSGFSTPRREIKVLVGPEDGGAPEFGAVTGEDNSSWLRLISFKRSAGAKEPDEAIFEYILNDDGRVVDTLVPKGFARQVAVYIDNPPVKGAGITHTLLWWGDIVGQRIGIDPNGGERIEILAQVRPYHFGDQLQGMVTHAPDDDARVDTYGPIVFDERIDGEILPNRSRTKYETDDDPPEKVDFWVSPESFRSLASATFQEPSTAPTTANPNPQMWKLAEAVHSLCWFANEDQEFIRNPKLKDLLIVNFGTDELKHHELPSGKYLAELLDELVTPYGFGWFLKPNFNFDESEIVEKITLFRHGVGKSVEVNFPRPGDPLAPEEANTDRLAMYTGIGELFNEIIGNGGWTEREVTIDLQRGWPDTEDNLSVGALTRNDEPTTALAHPLAWRLWVGNEAGDYCGLRTGAVEPNSEEPIDLSEVFGEDWIPERLRMQHCLTKTADTDQKDGRRRLPFLEYATDGENWKPVKNWGQTLLDNQIGVYFDGDQPPDDLIAAGDNARLRITGTIRSPQHRMHAAATRLESSPNGRTSKLTLDLSDRFFDRARQRLGDHTSQLWAADPFSIADERDDQTKLEEFVTAVQAVEDAAVMQASFRLPGVHLEYEIGDLIPKITGRNLSLNRKSKAATTKQYLQILAISVNHEEQWTELHTSSVDQILAGYQYPLTGGETRARFKELAPHGGINNG